MGVAADDTAGRLRQLLAIFGDGWVMATMWASLNEFSGTSTMSGGAEGDTLLGNVGIGDDVIVLADDLVDID